MLAIASSQSCLSVKGDVLLKEDVDSSHRMSPDNTTPYTYKHFQFTTIALDVQSF